MELSGSTDALDAATVRILMTSPGLDPLDVTAPVVGGRWSDDFTNLPEGAWTAFVRATDLSGNEDGSPAIIRFTVDRTPPETSVPVPLLLANQANPVITGTADPDAVSLALTFAPMSFDPAGGGGFRTIAVPVVDGQWSATLPTLFASGAQGRSFGWSAVATDAAGNTDPTPVTGIFRLDLPELVVGMFNDVLDAFRATGDSYARWTTNPFSSIWTENNAAPHFADFDGDGDMDLLEFRGYGTAAEGASFAQMDAMTWRITSADGLTEEVIAFANAAVLHHSDWNFV